MIPVSHPSIGELEKRYALQAIESGWISSTGEFVERFEQGFSTISGAKHTVPVANGTVALHLALLAAGVGVGDEVIVPSLTYIATANAVLYCNATPVFVDVDPTTWCIDPRAVAAAITNKTKAIIAVHLYGHPAAMTELKALADRHGITLVEDAAEGLLGTLEGKRVGNLGHISTFSFYGNKVLSCGEGGAVCTSSDELMQRVRLLRGQGMDPQRRYYFPIVGYNYRLTNVACAILCAQLERADELVAARHRLYGWYEQRLTGERRVARQPRAANVTLSPWLYSVLIEPPADRDAVANRLRDNGIETRPFFIPIHTMPPYRRFDTGQLDGRLQHTMRLGRTGLNLPTYPALSEPQVDQVTTALLASL